MVTDPKRIQEALTGLGPVYLYLAEYRMTHGYLHLRLTREGFHDVKAHLYLVDCDYISGTTLVGPCKVSLRMEREENQDVLVLSAEPNVRGGFTAKGLRISIEYPTKESSSPPA